MKRFYGIAAAVFLGLMTIALVGAESTAVAGHGCNGASECSGKCHGRSHKLFNRDRCNGSCHGEEASCSGEKSCHGRERCHGRNRCHGGLLSRLHRNKCSGAAECCGEAAPACEACGSEGCTGCGEAAAEAAPEAPAAPVEATGTSFSGSIFRN
ncbi:MAG: hypothetical protein ACO3NZ_07300 [Pirellulales bacterium]